MLIKNPKKTRTRLIELRVYIAPKDITYLWIRGGSTLKFKYGKIHD